MSGARADGHRKWRRDIETFAGCPANFAIIDDTSLTVAKLYDMLPAEAYLPDGRTANDSATVRTVYIIGPDKKVRLMMTYPMSVGRNFAEILRALDAVQATDGVPIATPADWRPGEPVIVPTASSYDTAEERMAGADGVKCEDWFFCTKDIPADEVESAIRRKD